MTAGDITQEEADEKLADIEANLDRMIDAEAFGPGFGHGPGGPFPGIAPDGGFTPESDATPESSS